MAETGLPKLFVLYIGGRHPGASIEVHDLRVVAAATLEETYPSLRRGWWGDPKSLHIDAWAVLEQADGHDIALSDEPSKSEDRLWFANLGGYLTDQFTEQHENLFVVAPNGQKAKVRALKQVQHWDSFHRDTLFEVESLPDLSGDLARQGLHVHLTPNAGARPFAFHCQYLTLGKAA